MGAGARRSTRLAINIPITIKGKDAKGSDFREDSRTIVVNKHGAKIATAHQLVKGEDVVIENRALGLTTRARVVWMGEKPSSRDHFEVGIQLIKADNIWGIQFPPEDWQEGAPADNGGTKPQTVAQPEKSPAAMTPPPKLKASPVPPPAAAKPAAPPVNTAPPPHAAPSTPTQASAELSNMVQRFIRQAEGIAAQQTKVYQENLESLSRRFGAQTQANLQETAARVEANATKTRLDLEDNIRALEARLQSLRAEVEAQTSAAEELRKLASSETETALQNIHEAGWQALEVATEELGERIKKELDTISADFVAELRKLLEEEGANSQKKQAADTQQQLIAMATSTAQSMNEAASEGMNAFHTELQRIIQVAQEQAGQQVEAYLSTLADRHCADLTARLEGAGSKIEGKLLAELHSKAEAAAQESDKAIAEREVALKRFYQGTLDAVAKASADIEESSKASAGALSKQFEGLAAEGLNRFRRDFESLLESSLKKLDEAAAAHQNQVMAQAQSKLTYVTEQLAADAAAQLTALTQDNLGMAETKLRESKERILNEWEETFRSKLAEVILPALELPDKKPKTPPEH